MVTSRSAKEIEVIVYESKPVSAARELMPELAATMTKVATEVFAANLQSFVSALSEVFTGLPATVADYGLDELQLRLEIKADGGIRLVGSVQIGATGGMTLVLRRKG